MLSDMDGLSWRSSRPSSAAAHSAVVVGTCDDMCPEAELRERGVTHQLSRLEQSDGSDASDSSRRLPVKAFSRTPDLSPGAA